MTGRRPPHLVAALCLAVLPGCGGSSAAPAPVTLTLSSDASLDGTVGSTGAVAASGQPTAGDNGVQGFHGLLSFALSGIPSGATVVSATLRVSQYGGAGSPYSTLGNVVVDHLDYGASLEAADYAVAAFASAFGTLSTDSTLGYKTVDVTARVVADLVAGRTRSQYRLRFSLLETNNDAVADQTWFNDAEDNGATGELPELVVTYTP